ncbi:glycoside hydrolase domain-containing protein [Bacillus sp. RAR_GA_16]|uniref:glycoside hydrolase domain-containing protein n=1 Tax=Bacillus sp. RAR_GA_16 TaxID=2876774 RepID=UPI001CCDC24C|nr:glycoside hydrolase domain-containing protein [Bacillus sp. RAR_GA_16]MCA0174578.1 DUF1906 domain-containing protein [Bacillus sp. RAR_GA_16]
MKRLIGDDHVDEMVLRVQQWVNLHYSWHPQYEVIDENGKTGWSTMYALTRALQIELGITKLFDNFGDGTASAYKQWGELELGNIPDDDKGTNIVTILQGGMYCKGYGPGGFTGTFGEGTKAAVIKLQTDAGLPIRDGRVYDYIFRAFLTMDAFVLTPGGDERIRKMQRDLNYNYYTTSGVQPSDGHYQRGTNRALIYGIQTEEGIAPWYQTGAVGPSTRNGLPTLNTGVQGNFVKLFQYALYVNNFDPGAFDGIYGQGVKNTVIDFQNFVGLTADGIAGKQTWFSALVSTGDSTRKGTACDCVTEITPPRAQALKNAGYEIVGRYLSNAKNSNLNKEIQIGELENIFDAGLKVFPIYQTDGSEFSYFGSNQGEIDAELAYKAARKHGFKKNTIIYFAVDFDALGYQIDDNIMNHFKSINIAMERMGGFYKVGVYGPRSVCSSVSEVGLATTSFVSGMSTGFSGNLGYPLPENWAFDQISTISVGSGDGYIEIDNNIASGRDIGQQLSQPLNERNDNFFSQLDTIYSIALENDYSISEANLVTLQYLREKIYNGALWDPLAGPIQQEFIDLVNEKVNAPVEEIYDPLSLEAVGVEHFAATLNSVIALNGSQLSDFGGWAGDLITAMGDALELVDDNKFYSIYEAATSRIGSYKGSFSFTDLLGDVDGLNIGHELIKSGNSLRLPDVIKDYYANSYQNRYSLFFKNRFDFDIETLYNQVDMLLNSTEPLLTAQRVLFIAKFGPFTYTRSEGEEMARAFTDLIMEKVNAEK